MQAFYTESMKKPGLSRLEEQKMLKRLARQDYQKLYLIFTEGTKTEPAYFAGFKRAIEANADARILIEIVGVGEATTKLMPFAIEFAEKYEIENAEIWLVSDKDDFPDAQFNAMVQQCARADGRKWKNNYWHAAWSNECFELWFLLHFSFYQAAASRQEYYRMLNAQFKKMGLGKYEKNADRLFEIMSEKGNPRLAIMYARKLYEEKKSLLPSRAKPCTAVYLLVQELARYLPSDLIKAFF